MNLKRKEELQMIDLMKNKTRYTLIRCYGKIVMDEIFTANGADVRVTDIKYEGDVYRAVKVNGEVVSINKKGE